jgi:hypothetical protein
MVILLSKADIKWAGGTRGEGDVINVSGRRPVPGEKAGATGRRE